MPRAVKLSTLNCETCPPGVMRTRGVAAPVFVSQMFPSGPVVIQFGRAKADCVQMVDTVPPIVIRPTLELKRAGSAPAGCAVNHIFPSGPAVMPNGLPFVPLNCVISPLGVIRPIPKPDAANHTLPSGP